MVEVVDTEDLKSFAYIRRGGSSPSVSTILKGGNKYECRSYWRSCSRWTRWSIFILAFAQVTQRRQMSKKLQLTDYLSLATLVATCGLMLAFLL